jgi:hypothetical protein
MDRSDRQPSRNRKYKPLNIAAVSSMASKATRKLFIQTTINFQSKLISNISARISPHSMAACGNGTQTPLKSLLFGIIFREISEVFWRRVVRDS